MYGEGQQESGSNGGMRAEDAWGSRNSGAVTSSAFSFKDLDDALDSMAVMEAQGCHTPPSSAASKATHPPLQPSKKECGRFSIRLGMAAPPLPEFYIYAEEEGERVRCRCLQGRRGAGARWGRGPFGLACWAELLAGKREAGC